MGIISKLITFAVFALYIFAWYNYPSQMNEFHGKALSFAWDKGKNFIYKMESEVSAKEQPSPGDRITESEIKVYKDKVEINRPDIVWSRYTDTNSMDPVLDDGANGLEIIPKKPEEVKVGDIIAYSKNDYTITHRVIEIDFDEDGWFAYARGDNNKLADPDKIRFDQIRGILVGVIY